MKNLQLLAVLCLVLTASATDLWFDELGAKLSKKDDDWYKFFVPCDGGSGKYDYDFGDVPAGWDVSNQFLLIPNDYNPGRYQVRLVAYDIEYRVNIESYVVIQLRANGDFDVFIRESYDISYNLEYYYELQDRDLYEPPSWGQIHRLIESGDISQIRGIILKTIDSDNDCDDKRKFLTGLLNRINKFLRDNNSDIKDAENEIKKLEREQDRLEKRLKELRNEKKGDSKEDIRKELKKVQDKIAWYEKRISNNKKKINDYKDDIKQFNKKIWEIKDKTLPKLRKQLKDLEQKLKEVVWKIKEGKGDIRWLKKQKYQLEIKIKRKEKQIKHNQKQIKDLQKKVDWFNKKIKEIEKDLKKDEDKLKDFQREQTKLRNQLKGSREETQIDKQIRAVIKSINAVKGRIKRQQNIITKIQKSIKKLQSNVQKFRKTIQESYFSCRDLDFTFGSTDGGSFFTSVDTRSFESYLEQNYGLNNVRGIGSNTRIVRVNLFSGVWTQSYGPAFGGFGSRFGDVFGCKVEGGSRRTRITKITKNSIFVSEQGRDYEVRIGDCSVLESATGRNIPKVGDNFVFKGIKEKDVFHLAKGLCY